VLGGTGINTNLQLYVRGGQVDLAKSGTASNYAVLNLLGVQTGSVVRLTGSNGNQIGGGVTLDGGVLDLNGISESIGALTNTVAGGIVTNSGAQAATLTVGEGGASAFFSGRLTDGASALTLAKIGAGAMTLSADAIAYTGGTRVEGGTLRLLTAASVATRLLRFTPTMSRPGSAGDPQWANSGYQFSEFQVLLNGVAVSNPVGTTAWAPFGPVTGGETPAKTVDGVLSSKWYTTSYENPLTIAFGQSVTFNSYRWATAGDAIGRDPIAWKLESGTAGADGTTNWFLIDTQTNYNPTTSRNTWIGTNFTVRSASNNVVPVNHPVTVAAGARLALTNLSETLEALAGSGAVVFEGSSSLTLTTSHAFTGIVSGAGTVVLMTSNEDGRFQPQDLGTVVRNDGTPQTVLRVEPALTNSFIGAVSDGASTLGITKTGAGLTYFIGTNSTYSGATRIEAGTADLRDCLIAQYVRFAPVLMRIGGANYSTNNYQISEFHLMLDGQGVSYPAGTLAYAPLGFGNPVETPLQTIDNNVNTKFFSSFGQPNPLIVKLPAPMPFDGYRWYTANDSTGRDPVTWTVSISSDGVNWTVVDTRSNQAITTSRNALAGVFGLSQLTAMNIFSDASATALEAPGKLSITRTRETVGALSGNGAIRLSAATLGLNAFQDAAFSGGITGTGTVVKTGAATQSLSGALAFSGEIIVETGVLDLEGAVLTGVTNIVIKSGATLTGAATVVGNLTVTFESGGAFSGSLAVSGVLTVTGPVKLAMPAGATYPFSRALFSYASADQATRDALAAAIKPTSVPTGHAATVRVTSTSARLIVAPVGTALSIR
jgi:autotransporter-associated beta strand protein